MIRLLTSLVLVVSTLAIAESGVTLGQLTSAIVDRQPVDDLQAQLNLPAHTTTTVFFYTQLNELNGQQVSHRWLYEQEPMADVLLDISANNWRTYSSKQIRSDWTGNWQVQVLHNENVIYTHDFVVSTP